MRQRWGWKKLKLFCKTELLSEESNYYILKQISKRIKIPMNKIPISLDRFGNNSSNSVPLVIADHFSKMEPRNLKH